MIILSQHSNYDLENVISRNVTVPTSDRSDISSGISIDNQKTSQCTVVQRPHIFEAKQVILCWNVIFKILKCFHELDWTLIA